MAHAKYYSPRLDRALVSRLYFEAKAQRLPMTVLTNRLVGDGLSRLNRADEHDSGGVAEKPPARDPV